MNPVTAVAPPAGWLPRVDNALAVLARPGQESADLGGLLYAFRRAGTGLALLCLTRGEASPLNSRLAARLETVRPWELQLAAGILGISQVTVASYPDGGLGWRPEGELSERIGRAARQYSADLLLIIDPAAGDREEEAADDAAVAAAACAAARRACLPVLAHTADTVPGAWAFDLGPDAGTARAIQKAAAAAHESQSPALPRLIRQLDLRGRREHLRWLVPPAWARRIPETQEETCPTAHRPPTASSGRTPLAVVTSRPWRRADTSC